MMPMWLLVVSVALLGVGAVACWWFIIAYSRRFTWWRNDVGRNMVTMSGAVGATYTYNFLALLWPEIPGRVIIRTVLFLAVTVAVVWRAVVFQRISREIDQLNHEVDGADGKNKRGKS